jgi:4-hydroxy-2-oxoheptanedioate aldolase
LKALNFEILWLKEKRDFYSAISKEDEKRLSTLESRYSHKISELSIGK